MTDTLTIVIPAFNEEKRLPTTLHSITSYLATSDSDAEVVVVDDGSTDRTSVIASSYGPPVRLIKLVSNQGKGAAVKAGVIASKGTAVLISDADLSTPIEDIEKLSPYLGPAHLVLGSRGLDSSDLRQDRPRHVLDLQTVCLKRFGLNMRTAVEANLGRTLAVFMHQVGQFAGKWPNGLAVVV